MGRALDIQLRVIPSRVANPFVDAHHYSGKHVNNSQLHLGAFLDGRLHGVMSFGPPMDRSHVLGLVEGTPWDGMIELNRMAFDELLPRNSESRCIGVAMRMLRRNAPQVKWVLSYADACSCGDGAIYRASNFVLTGIKRNASVARLPNGEELVDLAFRVTRTKRRPELGGLSAQEYFGTSTPNFHEYVRLMGGHVLEGFQLRYVYFLDKSWRKRLTVPELPYSAIAEAGATMYKGIRGAGAAVSTPGVQPGDGGSTPTAPLHAGGGSDE